MGTLISTPHPASPHPTPNPTLPMSAIESVRVEGTRVVAAGLDWEALPPGLGDAYGESAEALDLSYNELHDLEGLEGFSHLTSLVVDNNELCDCALPDAPKLETLSLNNNNLVDIENLLDQISEKYPSLRFLSLLKNPACPHPIFNEAKTDSDYHRYRLFCLHRLPALAFLDSSEVTDDERTEAKRVGKFMRVARPKAPPPDVSFPEEASEPADSNGLDALPDEPEKQGPGGARFGVSRYVYYGRQSEGNRFIMNEDL